MSDAVEPPAPRKIALLANCLLNQNAKVCDGARYRGLVNPVTDALRRRGYEFLQLTCPELAFAPLIERHLRNGDDVILIGLDGSPSSGVRFTSSKPDWGGRPDRTQDDWDIVPRRGIWIEELEAELARRGLPPVPATGWALDMGRFDEAGSRDDLERFLEHRER